MKVLVADELSAEGLEVLRKAPGVTVDVRTGLKPAELKAVIGEYDVLAVRSATKVTADVLENAGKLKLIGRAGVGVDNIDVEAATRKGVTVMNTPGGNSVAVAELTLGLMLALHRLLVPAISATKAGKWEKKRFAAGHELFRKTVGLIGFGNIGQLVAQRCMAFGATVIAYDPHPVEASRRLGVQIVPLDELFQRADIVSLHLPLAENTRNLVGSRLLGSMKQGQLPHQLRQGRHRRRGRAGRGAAERHPGRRGDGRLRQRARGAGPPAALPGQLPLHPPSRGLDRGGAAGLCAPARRAAGGVRPDRARPERPQRPRQ